MNKIKISPKGFTLIELLVVVLIIGILSAVALPAYRKAVEKSRVADALSTMDAVSKSEHGWYLMNNEYTKDFANLDIALIDMDGEKADGESYDTVNYTFTLQEKSIKAERSDGEYSLYKFYEENNIYCLPQEHYICQQFDWGLNKSLCQDIEGVFHSKSSRCYNSQKERCETEYNLWNPDEEDSENGWCGYTDTKSKELKEGIQCISNVNFGCEKSVINNGGECLGESESGCRNSIINNGGVCHAYKLYACLGSTINAGGICLVDENFEDTNYGCDSVTINKGGRCIGNTIGGNQHQHACAHAIINDGGVCEGTGFVACRWSTVNKGGECKASCLASKVYDGGICSGDCDSAEIYTGGVCSGVCRRSKIYDGGVCSGTCQDATINDGGICKSSETNKCKNATYKDSGCCCGNYCGDAPPCAASVCAGI